MLTWQVSEDRTCVDRSDAYRNEEDRPRPRNATRYPDQGDVFTVRYLRGHPDDFVIVRDDDSPWSNRLRCEDLVVKADQADRKAHFAWENSPFQRVAQTAHAALQSARCQMDDSSN